MASSIRIGFILFFFAALHSLILLEAVAFDFRQLCPRTSEPSTCLSAVEADPRTNLKSTPSGIATILNDKAKAMATATSTLINVLLKQVANPVGKTSLQSCSDLYVTVRFKLEHANLSQISGRTYRASRLTLLQAYLGVLECEDKFEKPFPQPNALRIENEGVLTVTKTTIEILNLSVCNKLQTCSP